MGALSSSHQAVEFLPVIAVNRDQVGTGRNTARAGYTCIFLGEAWDRNISVILGCAGSGAQDLVGLEAAPRVRAASLCGEGEGPVAPWEKGSSLGILVPTIL